jgi:hypothetical protein
MLDEAIHAQFNYLLLRRCRHSVPNSRKALCRVVGPQCCAITQTKCLVKLRPQQQGWESKVKKMEPMEIVTGRDRIADSTAEKVFGPENYPAHGSASTLELLRSIYSAVARRWRREHRHMVTPTKMKI